MIITTVTIRTAVIEMAGTSLLPRGKYSTQPKAPKKITKVKAKAISLVEMPRLLEAGKSIMNGCGRIYKSFHSNLLRFLSSRRYVHIHLGPNLYNPGARCYFGGGEMGRFESHHDAERLSGVHSSTSTSSMQHTLLCSV